MSVDSWETLSKKVYWDRDVPLERWRERISTGHRSYLPAAVSTMTPTEFVRFYGLSKFKRDWPALRAKLSKESREDTLRFSTSRGARPSAEVGIFDRRRIFSPCRKGAGIFSPRWRALPE
jgi:hypothetical protein